MGRQFLAAVVLTGIAGCATSTPEPTPPEPGPGPLAAAEIAESTSATGGELEFAEAPEVPQTAEVSESDPDALICQMERRTGSHRMQRVCRTRASIEREAIESKDRFDDLLRSQQNGLVQGEN